MKNRSKIRYICTAALLLVLSPALLGAGPGAETRTETGFEVETEIGAGIRTGVKAGAEPQADSLTWESPVFTGGGEEYRPKEEMEKEGKKFRLISTRIRSAKKEGNLTYASASIPLSLEGREEPPETAVISVTEEGIGTEFEREVPLVSVIEKETVWSSDFSVDVTVMDYDADHFFLGDVEIPDTENLSAYEKELLDFLGLAEDCYRINEVVWKGEAYEKDGSLCREAEARGEKLVRKIEAVYGGEVRTPEIQGKQYIGIYEEILSKPEEETAKMQSEEKREQETEAPEQITQETVQEPAAESGFRQWLISHITVLSVGIGALLICAAGIAFAVLFRKRRKQGEIR